MTRWERFCGWMLAKMGWTSVGGPVPEKKGVILGVPHTSVLDFVVSYLFYTHLGKRAKVMVKKEFFFWPVGPLLRKLGGVPVDRKSATTMLRSLISEMDKAETFHLALAPEGTRKATKRWKTGYHLIAKATGATVYLGYFDWRTKRISIGERFELTDDAAADTRRIQAIYDGMGLVGKHPEGYTAR